MSPVRSVTYVSGPDPFVMERAMGIEPTSEAWEASILPLYDARSTKYQFLDYTQRFKYEYRRSDVRVDNATPRMLQF
jgi:hypothetical protein